MLLWLTCTHGRYKCLQRNLKCYLDQVCTEPSVMFICNSGTPLKLPEDFIIPENKNIYIDNCVLMNFKSVGEKYQHALKLAVTLYPQIKIVNHADDDDIFLQEHLLYGSCGMSIAFTKYMKGYKPRFSWYRYLDEKDEVCISKKENNMEPSIFVDVNHLLEHGYGNTSISQHLKWLIPLLSKNELWVDTDGVSTLIYNWGDDWGTQKLSGSGRDTVENYITCRDKSKDMGNGILIPTLDNSVYYNIDMI